MPHPAGRLPSPPHTSGDDSQRRSGTTYELILARILGGKYAPGERLVETQVAKRLRVSRTPLREALFRLERDGFVESSVGRGFSVRPLTEREARETYPVVAALESEGVAEGAHLIQTDLIRLEEANQALASAKRDPVGAMRADRVFHELLVSRSSNGLLVRLVQTLHRILTRYELLYMADPLLVMHSAGQHEGIIEGIRRSRFDVAGAAILANYESGMRAVVEKLRSRGG